MRDRTRRREQSAIPAQHQGKIGMLRADLLTRNNLFAVGVLCGFLVKVESITAAAKPIQQLRQNAGQLGSWTASR